MIRRKEQDWSNLSPAEKKKKLFLKQKHLLDVFLAHHTITREQYEKSLRDMTIKMQAQDWLAESKEQPDTSCEYPDTSCEYPDTSCEHPEESGGRPGASYERPDTPSD